jgi:glycosyltransferase involved in cell wall biosynthesis
MKETALRVSVVIPSYNRAQYLSSAIDSIISQSYPIYEIIVVDDGSSDDTAGVCARYGKPVRYVYQDNAGPSSARNTGIEHATGELLAFLDSDDTWLPGKTERQVALFERDQSLGLCATANYNCDENGTITDLHCICPTNPSRIRREIFIRSLFCTPSVMVRRECFRHVGMFDTSYKFGEDWDMWIRILGRYRGAFIAEPLCKCPRLSSGISGAGGAQNYIDWLDIIKKNRVRAPTLYDRTIGNRRALSWYYLNLSYYHECQGQSRSSIAAMVASISNWPFNNYKRYYWLVKALTATARNYVSTIAAGKEKL